MPPYFNIEWLNACSQRSYPFAEHATRTDQTNSITVPDDFLLELYLPVAASAELPSDAFFIQSLTILGGGYTLTVAYDDGSSSPPIVATASISTIGFTENSLYALAGVNQFSDTYGKLVIGTLASISQLPAGVYEFTPAGGALDPDAIRPMIRGLGSLAVQSNGTIGPQLRNNVVISAGPNIRLTTVIQSGQDPQIRIDAVPGIGFSQQCPNGPVTIPCIRTINGIPGDAKQNFSILGDNCIKIGTQAGGIKLTDDCCQPCCGCTELDEIIRVLRDLQNSVNSLENYSSNLSSNVQTFQTVVMVSQVSSLGTRKRAVCHYDAIPDPDFTGKSLGKPGLRWVSNGWIWKLATDTDPTCHCPDPAIFADPLGASFFPASSTDSMEFPCGGTVNIVPCCDIRRGMVWEGISHGGAPVWDLKHDYCTGPPRGFTAFGIPEDARSAGVTAAAYLPDCKGYQNKLELAARYGAPQYMGQLLTTSCNGCENSISFSTGLAECAGYQCQLQVTSNYDWLVISDIGPFGHPCSGSGCVCALPPHGPLFYGLNPGDVITRPCTK